MQNNAILQGIMLAEQLSHTSAPDDYATALRNL
jgi:hypothetical protein